MTTEELERAAAEFLKTDESSASFVFLGTDWVDGPIMDVASAMATFARWYVEQEKR